MVTAFLVGIAAAQSASIFLLSSTFPAVPSTTREALEVPLIPILPFARHDGRFRLEVFRRKWLYWPLTRARRVALLMAGSSFLGMTESSAAHFRYVNISDGSSTTVEELPLKPDGAVRYVAISDTHLLHGDVVLPTAGDVLIHCGDILVEDEGKEADGKWRALLEDFNVWLGKNAAHFQHRLVTGGNHDKILEVLDNFTLDALLSHGKFVNGNTILVGVPGENERQQRVFLSAASRGYIKGSHTAFQYTSDAAAERIYSRISADVDVLVTHGPPQGILDGTGGNTGCPILLHHVRERIQPKVHLFGHWHDAPSSMKAGDTVYINAASIDFDYAATHSAVVFDMM